MELTAQEKSAAFWGATMGGLVKGLILGAVIGAVAAGGIFLLAEAGVFSALGITGLTGFVTNAAGNFFPLTMMFFNGIITGVAQAFTSGKNAVDAAQHAKQTAFYEQRVAQLESREQIIEQVVGEHLAPQRSTVVSGIISRGPRPQGSYAAAEESREAQAPTPHTLH